MQLVAYNTTGALFATQLVVVVEWHDRKVGYLLNYLNQEISTFLTFSTTRSIGRGSTAIPAGVPCPGGYGAHVVTVGCPSRPRRTTFGAKIMPLPVVLIGAQTHVSARTRRDGRTSSRPSPRLAGRRPILPRVDARRFKPSKQARSSARIRFLDEAF